jgi:hypothetical protein
VSARSAWLRFERRGGSPPRDDEEVRVAEDGSFTARRTIGGVRIGAFRGRLSGAQLARLRPLVEAVESADDLTMPTPNHGATETLEVAGRTLRLGSNEAPARPWRAVLDRARRLLRDDVVASPLAAIELVADAATARLAHAGTEPIDADLGSVSVRVVRIGGDGTPSGHWTGFAEGRVDDGERLVPTPAWATAGPGWQASLPFGHGLALGPGDWLQVWVELDIREAVASRRGQLYAPVQGGR